MNPTTNPPNNDHPHFVADQLLTAADLNNVFEYLDEQERLTRANLIGIGVVCGLEVSVDAAGGYGLLISKGCGVTSMGYLVTYNDEVQGGTGTTKRKFTHYKKYDAFESKPEFQLLDGMDTFDTDDYYADRWLDKTVDPAKQTDLFQLLTSAEEGATALSEEFLKEKEKIVLVLVELKKVFNKNCDPDSCDDKGETIEVTFRFLLIGKDDADKLLNESAQAGLQTPSFFKQNPLRRFDVPATDMLGSADVVQAYLDIFSETANGKNLSERVEGYLTDAYNDCKALVLDIAGTNPFSGLSEGLKFLTDGTLTGPQLLNVQYCYDFLSDLLQALKELNDAWTRVKGMCVPPNNPFPRHLFLGRAVAQTSAAKPEYRTPFIPSPVLDGQHQRVEELRFLFRKLVLMLQKFVVLSVQTTLGKANVRMDPSIRITPSKLGDVAFSQKAIPFYYDIKTAAPSLFEYWNYEKWRWGLAAQNLSYHAAVYNSTDEFVTQPLLYDLEPYNFLRIEGHVGKNYVTALRTIETYKASARLPFTVLALGADFKVIQYLSKLKDEEMFEAVKRLIKSGDADDADCHFNDLESLYDSLLAEFTCNLCKEMKYFYDLASGTTQPPPATTVPAVTLLQKCDPAYRYRPNTFGHLFELFYPTVKNQPYISAEVFIKNFQTAQPAGAVAANNNLLIFGLLYLMQKLYETFEDDLPAFDYETFAQRADDLLQIADFIKKFVQPLLANPETPVANLIFEDIIDHLDAILYNCKNAPVKGLVTEYRKRFLQLFALRKFGYFVRSHPGIQHKAGVPLGGTFLMVYHEESAVGELPEPGPEIKVQTGKFRISGRLIDATGAPLPGVLVTAADANTGHAIKAVTTSFTGNFLISITVLPVRLSVQTAGFKTFEILADKEAMGNVDVSQSQKGKRIITNKAFRLINEIISDRRGKDDSLDGLFEEITEGTVIADFYLPYACCSDCPPVQYTIREPEPVNQPPVANAGPDQTLVLPANATTLDGSASFDSDGTITAYAWVQKSGPMAATIQQPSAAKTAVANMAENGTYIFELTVTDNGGLSAKDEVSVIVNPPQNGPLVANAGPDRSFTVGSTAPLILDGSQSKDPDGTIVSFAWKQVQGPNTATVNNADKPQATVTNIIVGTYVFELTVKDNGGATGTDTVTVTAVRPPATKVCLPVDGVLADFKNLPNINPEVFARFTAGFASYWQVEQYFAAMASVITSPVDKQIDFFGSPVSVTHPATGQKVNVILANDLHRWISEVFGFAQELPLTRLIALNQYRILVRLAMYVACIQNEDIDKAKVPMITVFAQVVATQINGLPNSNFFAQLNTQEKAVFTALLNDFKEEVTRLNNSGEAATKTIYLSILEKMIQSLSSVNPGIKATPAKRSGRKK